MIQLNNGVERQKVSKRKRRNHLMYKMKQKTWLITNTFTGFGYLCAHERNKL